MPLHKSFAIYSFLAALISALLLVYAINKHMENDYIEYIEEITYLSLNNIIEDEIKLTDTENLIIEVNSKNLDSKLESVFENYNIIGIRIWNIEGEVFYSNMKDSIEIKYKDDKNLRQAFSNVSNSVITKGVINKEANNKNKKFKVIKMYIPFIQNNKVISVSEVIKSYEDIGVHIRTITKIIASIIFLGLLILYLFLMKVMYNTSKKLFYQNQCLMKNSKELRGAYSKLQKSYKNTIITLSNAIDARDPYTAGHSKRVAKISVEIGKNMTFSNKDLESLELAALLHDVGKIGISDAILNKPGKLTEDEFNKIKEHPEIGVNILKDIESFQNILQIIKFHHERIAGGGYPLGIKGNEIPLESRIIAVADAYDAMTSDRTYRKGLPHNVAIEELTKYRNIQFDKDVVDTVLKIEDKIKRFL
ncbi:HD-GYP domain-containing protein [Oceanirhabdus sp. W0125-5]|uniref:HD-GYP domain-containing protein n=1 Tax=Oceanirhabdus sp. W0125-5 TaxID=2999116 RepID=UPI0022F2B0BD|nr:HD-GYP domain-containing protein [Oceanirhabdus sp. W0125-5]WBW99765.1 HD-GYP domain-containing protein [Oceanirhabdus sp. W0125-5]